MGQLDNLLVLLDDIVIDKRIPVTGKLANEKNIYALIIGVHFIIS